MSHCGTWIYTIPCISMLFWWFSRYCWAMLSQCRGTSCASAWRRRRPWRSHCRSRWLRNKTKTLRSSFEAWQSDKAWIWLTEDMEDTEYMKDLDSLGQIIIKWHQVTKSIQESAFQVITWYHFPIFSLVFVLQFLMDLWLKTVPRSTENERWQWEGSTWKKSWTNPTKTKSGLMSRWSSASRQDITRMIFSFYLRSKRTVQNQFGLIWISSQELLT